MGQSGNTVSIGTRLDEAATFLWGQPVNTLFADKISLNFARKFVVVAKMEILSSSTKHARRDLALVAIAIRKENS